MLYCAGNRKKKAIKASRVKPPESFHRSAIFGCCKLMEMTVQIWLWVFHVRPLHYTSLVKYIIHGEWSVNGVTWLHFHVTRNIIRRYKEPVMTRIRVWNRPDDNAEMITTAKSSVSMKNFTPLRFILEILFRYFKLFAHFQFRVYIYVQPL